MSRRRSPGRTARDHSARHRAAPAVRNGLAAAVTGGALAALVPSIPVPAAPTTTPAPTATLSLASEAATVMRVASVVPVRDVPPPVLSVPALVKSAGLAEAAQRAEAATRCDADLDGLGRVRPWARDAARFLSCLHGEPDLIGVAGRSRQSDHPSGLAVDFMMTGARGDRLAACALANRAALGIDYVIWKQRINYGDGWEGMEDRGGATENHFDHVHVSFRRTAGAGTPVAGRCS